MQKMRVSQFKWVLTIGDCEISQSRLLFATAKHFFFSRSRDCRVSQLFHTLTALSCRALWRSFFLDLPAVTRLPDVILHSTLTPKRPSTDLLDESCPSRDTWHCFHIYAQERDPYPFPFITACAFRTCKRIHV